MLVAVGIVFEPPFVDRSSAEVARQAASEPVADCSGALSGDYSCYQERYKSLVRVSGVETAFDELKEEYGKNGFARSNCHQMTHVIGRAAADLYGGIPTMYGHGDSFCG
ncbi:MAG: hypothetical protein M3118_03290, partial [Actinomycetota bacterium]|nr:hypothetical protein [Actinomycetota bacterium]